MSEIAQAIAARGHEIHVATASDSISPRYEISAGVHVHRFPVSGNSVLGIHGDAASYIQFVLQGDWDCIVLYNAQIWTTDLLLEHLPHLPPTILSLQGLSAASDPRYSRYLEVLATAAVHFQRIVCVSRSSEDWTFFSRHQPNKVAVIPNGVDWQEWDSPPRDLRAKWGIGDRPWVVNVSNHNPAKNHALLFRTVHLMKLRMPDLAVTLIGTHHLQQRWPQLSILHLRGGCWYACRWAVRRHSFVTLSAQLPRVDVVSCIQEADAFLLTSSWEASPVVIGEAMAAATPWVSTDVGDVREHAGGIVRTSAVDLANSCVALLTNPAQRRALGDAGRGAMRQRSWDKIATEYEVIYRQLLEWRAANS